jgi:hypothetical protein
MPLICGLAVLSAALRSAAAQQAASHSGGASSGQTLWVQSGVAADFRPAVRLPAAALHLSASIGSVTDHLVRVAYIIPTNRTAQASAILSLQRVVQEYQSWYGEQMVRNGFGPKTFRYETESDGVTPRIHTVSVVEPDDYLRADLWGRTIAAASAAGVPVWTPQQVWWLLPEAHLENADGSITGGTALGASFGSGDDPGVAMVGSDALARYQASFATNDTAYQGQFILEIGPYALVQSVSFPWFEGTTFSSTASSVLGAGLHEMSHAFGQPHDFRNDNNFNGNLMGNGLRGWRGALYPARYPSDDTRAAYGSALALNVSRYFNPETNYTDNVIPTLVIRTTGANPPVNGLLQIEFQAADLSGLAAAWLLWKGDLVGELRVGGGTDVSLTFSTAYYDPGQANQYTISVFDRQGNRANADTTIIPSPSSNRAPQPYVNVIPPSAVIGQDVVLDASQSIDPDNTQSDLRVEWDLNGDNVFDTAPTTAKMLTTNFLTAGPRLVRARVTDPAGAQTLSTPLALAVEPLTLSIARTAHWVQVSWKATANGFELITTPTLAPPTWSAVSQPAVINGNQKVVTFTNPTANAYFQLRK